MHIVVCIKQVPDTTDVKIDRETNTLIRSGVESIINPYDVHALEEALRLKEKHGGKVTAISMGPGQVKDALKEAVSLGVDDVILISDRKFAGADTLATSYTLATAIKKMEQVDLIMCGKQAIDGDTAQVGPGIAEELELPHTTYVQNIIEVENDQITVERETETGYEVIQMKLPALITTLKKINEPRLPSIRGTLRAREIEIPVWSVDDLADIEQDKIGLDGSPTQVVSVDTPELKGAGTLFTGEPKEQVNKLLDALSEQQVF